MWVARFHYRYADDVRTIVRNCAKLGCNTIYWQVRGAGTVAFRSQREPWSDEFEFRDPGFDPLALAVEEAHKNGLRIEAWVNVLPGWKGTQPPPLRNQLWNARPAWFLQDEQGRRQPLGDFYLILNPCLPDARRHIVGVMEEIAARYNVDGIHLDYVRYAWDTQPKAEQRYPRDERTLALYRKATGKHPDDDPELWDRWRAEQLTLLVAEIRDMLEQRRPGATLTAAVVANPNRAYDAFFQDGVGWLRRGLVDALVPMAYSGKLDEFKADIAAYRQHAGRGRIIPGVGAYKHPRGPPLRAQLEQCQRWGGDFALFSYGSLFSTDQDRRGGGSSAETKQRGTRRAVVEEFTRR